MRRGHQTLLGWLLLTCGVVSPGPVHAQVSAAPRSEAREAAQPPALKAGFLPGNLRLDGVLDEDAWTQAEAIEDLTMLEPVQGARPTGRTRVRVLANADEIVFGVECDDPDPRGIVSYTKQRDGAMSSEDHIEIVLDPVLRRPVRLRLLGESGRGAVRRPHRPRERRPERQLGRHLGGGDEARRHGLDRGNSHPDPDPQLHEGASTTWHFNIQRRIQRLQENERWASPRATSS